MQIYLGGGCLHGFDKERAFGTGYMAGNLWASQKHREQDENNMEYGDKSSAKS